MTRWFDRLNLQPQERRLVLGAIVVVALVLNYWIVWPYFQDWPKVNRELEELLRVKSRYLAETGKTNQYNTRLASLRSMGAQVAPEDAPTRLQVTILTNANATGVQVNRLIPVIQAARGGAGSRTNEFFEEYQVTVDVIAGEPELVAFLFQLGSGESMVRVRDVSNLRLDPSQTKLTCTLTLVASFPRRTPPPSAAPKKPLPGPAVKPKTPTTAPRSPATVSTNKTTQK